MNKVRIKKKNLVQNTDGVDFLRFPFLRLALMNTSKFRYI